MTSFSRPGPLRPQREKNFFIVSGLPEHFNWQKLKDLVRDATTNQPGWTNMDESWHGPEGAKGYFSVKSDQDAASVYHLLVVVMYARLGRPLLVHHFDASSRDAVLLMCNCSTYYPGATGHSDNRSRITARSVLAAQNIPDWQPITPVPFVTIPMQHPSMTVPITVGQMHMYTTSAAYYPTMPAVTAPTAPPMTNEHGLPVNIANGVVRTESRGVHISGLVWGVSENDIRELVRPYGRPQAVEVKRSSATIRFGSVEEARQVIERLDQIRFHERRITVKEDRESTPVQDPGMLIVNGNPQRVSRAQATGNSPPARKLTCIWRRHIARQGDERANGQAGRDGHGRFGGGQWRGGGIGAGQVGGAYGVVFPGRLICVLRCFEMYDC